MEPAEICKCCQRPGMLNSHRLCGDCAVCLHCERRAAVSGLGLCRKCHRQRWVRQLYRRSYQWSSEWEMHLRRKTTEVQERLLQLKRAGPLGRKLASS